MTASFLEQAVRVRQGELPRPSHLAGKAKGIMMVLANGTAIAARNVELQGLRSFSTERNARSV